jgi:putative Ca2+/H+ antiporter (TMEM165/GDT1 family)
MPSHLIIAAASASTVALAEIGDKTMLLAIMLASRFRQPWRIVAGIFCATVINHLCAAFVGSTAAGLLTARPFRLAVGAGFLAMAIWTLIPDKLDPTDTPKSTGKHSGKHGAFLTTLVSFFLVEMGDKTQIATIALAARFHDVPSVAAGTTLGMMLADAPAVFLGHRLVEKIPLKAARLAAAALFAGLGIWQLWAVLGQ